MTHMHTYIHTYTYTHTHIHMHTRVNNKLHHHSKHTKNKQDMHSEREREREKDAHTHAQHAQHTTQHIQHTHTHTQSRHTQTRTFSCLKWRSNFTSLKILLASIKSSKALGTFFMATYHGAYPIRVCVMCDRVCEVWSCVYVRVCESVCVRENSEYRTQYTYTHTHVSDVMYYLLACLRVDSRTVFITTHTNTSMREKPFLLFSPSHTQNHTNRNR